MKTRKSQAIRKSLYLGLLCVVSAGIAQASTIDISSGTGIDTYQITTDTNSGTPDDSYTGPAIVVTSLPTGTFTHVTGLSDGTDTGEWIGPAADQASDPAVTGAAAGSTTYTVTFDLTGYNYATATLVLSFAADDYVNSVVLNTTTIFTATTGEKDSGMWTSTTDVTDLDIPAGDFISGLNTLTFVVPNNGSDDTTSCCGPTGLEVAADVFATPTTVPEPGTFALTGLSLAGLGMLLRRRNAAKNPR